MKKFNLALGLSLVICLAAVSLQLPFSRACADLRNDTLRLHVVANSDSEADQAVKLSVRDALLEETVNWYSTAAGRDAVAANLQAHTSDMEQVANRVLQSNGITYTANAYITDMYFEQRSYGNITMPAGVYRALRVELGEASGRNWWCVVYPSLCVPSATEEETQEALAQYDEAERDVVLGGSRYVVKFKVDEWLQQLFPDQDAANV